MSTKLRSPLWWTGIVLAGTGLVGALAVLDLGGSDWSVAARVATRALGIAVVVAGLYCVVRAEMSMRNK